MKVFFLYIPPVPANQDLICHPKSNKFGGKQK